MGSGDDDKVWTHYDGHIIGGMFRYHDLNQNTTDVKISEPVYEMTNRQDDKSPMKDIRGWKFDNSLTSQNKVSPNSNLPYKNLFFTEDSCSNDFFYDEEFTIPFDANLTEQRDVDESFLPRHHFGIVTSKSDNCLYAGDVGHPESDPEVSESEQEIFSSSDSSELFNHPLFSSHSECPDEFALDASDNEASSVIDDFPKDVRKLNHMKHHYKISFDRGPLKVWSSSDEPASKVSLELKPPNKIAQKPSTLGFQKNGVIRSYSCRKPGSVARKSKKKSQKIGTTWNSKSSHHVTWGMLKNSPTNEGNKPRTSWKEINIKPNIPQRKEVEEDVLNNLACQSNVESCQEMIFDQHLEKNDAKVFFLDAEESQAKQKQQMNNKSCELFKIYQDKKLKEVEDHFEDNDTLKALKSPQFCLHENEAPFFKNEEDKRDLKDIFEISKHERKLKFKSHSIEPNNSSPVQESERSPKIMQSANLASTTSTDSSVQTSLIISIPVKTENKSLQTSFAEDKQPETSVRDIWNTSSYLFSRPLPDLSFLKNSSKFIEPTQKVDPPSAVVKQPKSLAKEEMKSYKKLNPQNNNKSNFKQTFTKSKQLNNSKISQESSGRSKSSSSFSFHSSSSSGIDPGTSDSGRQSSSASSKDESLHSDLKTPPKPPRLFKSNNSQSNELSNNGSLVKDDNVTNSIKNNSKNIEACKEQNIKISNEIKNARNIVRSNHQIRRSPSSHDRPDPCKTSKVVLRNNAQPTKSILVRSRSKENRRSWSNNLQSNESRPTGEHPSPRKRPLSVPDGNLLEMTMPTKEEEKPCEDKNVVNNPLTTTTALEDKSHSGEDNNVNSNGNNITMTTASEHDYEKFRAKKSVSFSETISYHPTTSSLSPLESPKSPVNSVPTSPEVDGAQDIAKDCPDPVQDATEDVELPPNDFLVSPNISPASSLTDSSSSNLYHPNFDLQQKKDLVMDVIKAVDVVFRHVNKSKDPLGRVKLCSTVDNPKIGNLLLEHLCPSIHAIVLDGIKPSVPGLFGKVKSSACKVFEDSLEGSPFDSLNHLMKSMKDLKFLSNPWLKFNAYLFALLNLKVLDMWLASLRRNRPILSRYYNATSFLQLSSSCTCQSLFHEVISALQPLCQIQFRLEYDFEVNVVERKRQAFIAEQLLNKHVSCSSEVQAETESYLSRMHNTFSLDSSSAVGKAPKHPALSLCLDEKKSSDENKNRDTPEENSEPSLFLLWSSVDFGGLARGFLQKTQTKLIEKLSQSRDMFSFEGNGGLTKVDKPQNTGSLSESSMQQNPPQPSSFMPHLSPQMTCSDCPRPCPEFASPLCENPEKVVVVVGNPASSPSQKKQPLHLQTQTPKSQTGLFSSYGSKIIGVFDRLLLDKHDQSDDNMFLVRKKYHSEDQISRHVSSSPKHNPTGQQSPVLAKSVSCESEVTPRSKLCNGQSSKMASSNLSRFRLARSLCHYVAMNNQFLSFEKDVEMMIIKEVGHDFFLCRLDDAEGLVYRVCVAIVC